MRHRITISLLLAAVLIAPLRLAAQSCILSNAASQQGCQPGSCENKACCVTSAEHKAAPAQPSAKSDSALILMISPGFVAIAISATPAKKLTGHPADLARPPAAPGLALLCTFLI